MSRRRTTRRGSYQLPGQRFVLLGVMVAVAGLMAIAYVNSAPSTQNNNQPFAEEPPLAGTPVASVGDAEAIVGYTVQIPQSLPSSFALQGVRVVKEANLVYLIFGDWSLPSETLYFSDLISSGYWIFIQSPQPLSLEGQQALIDQSVSDANGYAVPIEIGGSPGYIVCPGDFNNHAVWWGNGIRYELVTPVGAASSEMVEFANSVTAA